MICECACTCLPTYVRTYVRAYMHARCAYLCPLYDVKCNACVTNVYNLLSLSPFSLLSVCGYFCLPSSLSFTVSLPLSPSLSLSLPLSPSRSLSLHRSRFVAKSNVMSNV